MMTSAAAALPVSPSIAEESPAKRPMLLAQMLVAAGLMLAIGLYFWVDSRYPALLKKLHTGTAIKVSGAISFDALMPVTPQMPLATRVGHTTVNWMWTNRIGMTFGIFFGAAILTLFSTLPRVRFRSASGNTLAGALAGVPLGVCANCVAPIGRSLFVAGGSSDTVLATMISSPMLNVIVLALAFTLFPLKIALVRLAVPLILIALVPLIVRRTKASPADFRPVSNRREAPRNVIATVTAYFKNLGKLALTTIPFMVLAAFLGALAVELLPAQSIPQKVTVLGILLIALVGTFLPVPMAFDVAAAFLLMTRGVPIAYVVTLLCTLGAFSIYPFLIVGRTISWRTAAGVFAAVMLLGAAAGLGTALLQHSL